MVRECDCARFRTVVKTVAELWLELWPEFEGTLSGGRELKRKPHAWPFVYEQN